MMEQGTEVKLTECILVNSCIQYIHSNKKKVNIPFSCIGSKFLVLCVFFTGLMLQAEFSCP